MQRDQAFYSAALRNTAAKTAGVVGDTYFRTLVQSLAESFDVEAVFVAEFAGTGTRVKQLAKWSGGAFAELKEFDTLATPCRDVIAGHRAHHRQGLCELFPREKGLESYLGVPLLAEDKSVIGHLALFDTRPFDVSPDAWMVLQTFAARAAVELARKRAHGLLDSMMDSVMDAILVVGPERRIDLCNPAAGRMFGIEPNIASGKAISEFMSDSLAALFDQYASDAEDQLNRDPAPLWSRGDLAAVDAGGERFPVDVTVSPTDFGGTKFYTIVLRDLRERHASERAIQRLAADNAALKGELRARQEKLVGGSPALQSLLEEIEQVAPTDATVLVAGETGTGKELIATAVHELSSRSERILIKLNCATLPRELIESELFGHEKGAFTGALQRKRGRFELADGGTIFLDEVGELSLEAQAKLLRVLQEREVERIGGSAPIRVDVRVIAATNRDLASMVAQGDFRADLYYRLEVFPINAPPLRERREDIATLARFFLERFSRAFGKSGLTIDEASLARLRAYDWPGNVRELQNVIERATILARRDILSINPNRGNPQPDPGSDTSDRTLDDVQRSHIARILEQTGGVIDGPNGAAAVLGLHPNTLRSRMKKLGIGQG